MIPGSCLCGRVRFEVIGRTTDIGMCHCSKCRKVSGVASNANLMTALDGLRWTSGEDAIVKFALPDGWGPWRCGTCGSPVPQLHPGGGAWWIPAGLLDADPGVPIAGHIFVGSRAPWDEIAGAAPRFVEDFHGPRLEGAGEGAEPAPAPSHVVGESPMGDPVEPIGRVRAARTDARDDDWGGVESWIELETRFEPEALDGLEQFSHAEILFLFDRVDPDQVVRGARRPRGNPAWPAVGIFAQRAKGRPNRIGSTICRIVAREGRRLRVAELDAIDGTPVLDIKPVMREFLPRGELRQPAWVGELMARYWARGE